jgi:hypothetical protein
MKFTPFVDAGFDRRPNSAHRGGSAASTLFIGVRGNNFSYKVKILFRTLCRRLIQCCAEADQPLTRNRAPGDSICFNDRPDTRHSCRCNRPRRFQLLAALTAPSLFAHKKIGGKRMPLAATGIDFNRILLSA